MIYIRAVEALPPQYAILQLAPAIMLHARACYRLFGKANDIITAAKRHTLLVRLFQSSRCRYYISAPIIISWCRRTHWMPIHWIAYHWWWAYHAKTRHSSTASACRLCRLRFWFNEGRALSCAPPLIHIQAILTLPPHATRHRRYILAWFYRVWYFCLIDAAPLCRAYDNVKKMGDIYRWPSRYYALLPMSNYKMPVSATTTCAHRKVPPATPENGKSHSAK